ncbi:unnamed protein product [Urochloa humidicola]
MPLPHPTPRLLAGGDYHLPPTSSSSPEHPFRSADVLLPSPSPSLADLSSPHLSHALAFTFLTQSSLLPRHLLVALHAAGARFPAFYQAFASTFLPLPFPLLLPHMRACLLLAFSKLAHAAAPGFTPLLTSLLRRVLFPELACSRFLPSMPPSSPTRSPSSSPPPSFPSSTSLPRIASLRPQAALSAMIAKIAGAPRALKCRGRLVCIDRKGHCEVAP